MSDQFTRITCGGSALPRDAPVVGLLFGRCLLPASATTTTTMTTGSSSSSSKKKKNHPTTTNSTNTSLSASSNTIVQIIDADDIPTDRSETAKLQISLHQAVFPQHEVVGWYRVQQGSSGGSGSGSGSGSGNGTTNNEAEPTLEDWQLTQELKTHYYTNTEGDASSAVVDMNAATCSENPFFFALLQVRPPTKPEDSGLVGTTKSNNNNTMKDDDDDNNNNNNKNDEDNDDELPLTLYEVQKDVLVGIEDWSLETSEAERIAVERVVREKPQPNLWKTMTKTTMMTTTIASTTGNQNNDATSGDSGTGAGAGSLSEIVVAQQQLQQQQQEQQLPSPYVSYMSTVQQSLVAMEDRIQLIIDYLERMPSETETTTISNPSLMRQIQGLILQLGPLQHQQHQPPQQLPLTAGKGSTTSTTTTTTTTSVSEQQDAALLSHLAILTKTIQSVQSYSEKFRILHENSNNTTNNSQNTTTGGGGGGGGREGRRGY